MYYCCVTSNLGEQALLEARLDRILKRMDDHRGMELEGALSIIQDRTSIHQCDGWQVFCYHRCHLSSQLKRNQELRNLCVTIYARLGWEKPPFNFYQEDPQRGDMQSRSLNFWGRMGTPVHFETGRTVGWCQSQPGIITNRDKSLQYLLQMPALQRYYTSVKKTTAKHQTSRYCL